MIASRWRLMVVYSLFGSQSGGAATSQVLEFYTKAEAEAVAKDLEKGNAYSPWSVRRLYVDGWE